MDKQVIIWRVEEEEKKEIQIREKTGILSRETLTPISLAWNRKKKRLAIGTREGNIHVLDSNWNTLQKINNAHEAPISSVEFNQEGDLLLSGGFDSYTKVWKVKSGKFNINTEEKQPLRKEFSEHGGSVYDVRWGSDGDWIASSGKDATIFVWDTKKWELQEIRGHNSSILSFTIRFPRV